MKVAWHAVPGKIDRCDPSCRGPSDFAMVFGRFSVDRPGSRQKKDSFWALAVIGSKGAPRPLSDRYL
jgi:hypothetical protein